MTRLALLAAFGALAACIPQAGTAPDEPEAPAPARVPLTSLAGEYRVAGIDDAPVDAPFGLALSVTAERIIFEGPCGGYAWDYRLEGRALQTTQRRSPDPACIATARIHPLVFRLGAALDAVRSAGRDASNAVVLSGGGHSVTLYSQ